MNKHQVKGMTNRVTGEVKQQVGRLTGDRSAVAAGKMRETKGELQQGMGDAKEAIKHNSREIDRREMNRGGRRSSDK